MGVYRVNKNIKSDDLVFYSTPEVPWRLEIDFMVAALELANSEFRKEYEFNKNRPVSLINNIPKKNLSGSVGECFGRSLSLFMGGRLGKNTHESSGPDMLPCIPETKDWLLGLKKEYCPFEGFDMKGCVTEKMEFMKVKPSSHHDQTNSVLTVQWVSAPNTYAEIVGLYYTRHLERSDWKINMSPKKKDSKLTSNAILLPSGLEKIRKGWVVMRNDVVLPKKKDAMNLYFLNEFAILDSKDITARCD